MEASLNPNKRKKRRTRKCLDEIRKKSRRNCEMVNIVRLEKHNNASKSNSKGRLGNNDRCSITSKRLTLRPMLFSKAIKSETITRPQITSRQPTSGNTEHGESSILKSFIRGSETAQNIGKQLKNNHNGNDSEAERDSKEIEEISFHDDSDSNQENDSPKSFIVFSPISQAIETEVIEESPFGTCSGRGEGVSMSSASSAVARAPHELYSEFMDEVTDHLDRIAPDFIQPGIMRRTHKYLCDVYLDGCRQQTEQEIMQSFQCDNAISMSDKENEPSNAIVENPMQYIRMGMQGGQVLRELKAVHSTSPPPTFPRSPQSPSSSPTRLSIINDTPEYTFYPRKLNQ